MYFISFQPIYACDMMYRSHIRASVCTKIKWVGVKHTIMWLCLQALVDMYDMDFLISQHICRLFGLFALGYGLQTSFGNPLP